MDNLEAAILFSLAALEMTSWGRWRDTVAIAIGRVILVTSVILFLCKKAIN